MFIRVHAPGKDEDFLVGKYSQSFLNELSSQIEREIERATSVTGLGESKIELQLVFAPGTYMEHTSESVTYRRLLLIDNASRPRDFWVKWTRLDGNGAYTVSDDVTADDIRFEIGEGVPQKIREREFRFLCSSNPDKYQSAMGKKNATEWRDIIKRALKYGVLTRAEAPQAPVREIPKAVPVTQNQEPKDDLTARLAQLLEMNDDAEEEIEEIEEELPVSEEAESFDDIVELARRALLKFEEEKESIAQDTEESSLELDTEDEPETEAPTEEYEPIEDTAEAEENTELEEKIFEAEEEIVKAEELDLREAAVFTPVFEEPVKTEADIRREIEDKIRLEYEMRAREMAEMMQAEREKHERAMLEAEEQHKKKEEELRLKVEASMQREARERDRLAEAARQAVLEQRRNEEESIDEQPPIAPKPVLTQQPIATPKPVTPPQEQRPTEWMEPKHARLVFRNTVPTNAISAIKGIVEKTLIEEGKENIDMHIKAYPIDANTIGMDILKMPRDERELLVKIMKAIGRGGVGISKITVE